jgi:hypothetical protein
MRKTATLTIVASVAAAFAPLLVSPPVHADPSGLTRFSMLETIRQLADVDQQ